MGSTNEVPKPEEVSFWISNLDAIISFALGVVSGFFANVFHDKWKASRKKKTPMIKFESEGGLVTFEMNAISGKDIPEIVSLIQSASTTTSENSAAKD